MKLFGVHAADHLKVVNRALACGYPFSFSRFSDGELFMLLGKEIRLTPRGAWIDGKQVNGQRYAEHDCKTFIPSSDVDVVEQLGKAYRYKRDGYIVGMPYACCVGEEMFRQLIAKYGSPDLHTTANLFTDNNYDAFIRKTVRVLQGRDIILVAHQSARTELFPRLVSHVGIAADSGKQWKAVHKELRKIIFESNNREDLVVLASASYMSNILCYKIAEEFKEVTFLDIGTSLHPLLGLGHIRQYLIEYWNDRDSYEGHRCHCTI